MRSFSASRVAQLWLAALLLASSLSTSEASAAPISRVLASEAHTAQASTAVSGQVLDLTFGNGGSVSTDFAEGSVDDKNGDRNDAAKDVVVQADGKILAVGVGATGLSDFALSRYSPDGVLDSTFGRDGKVSTDFGKHDYAEAVALQADGKIVVAGTVVGTSPGDSYMFGLARYNSNGSLDSTFDGDGKVITDFTEFPGRPDTATDIIVQGDGKIVVTGNNYWDFALARYNPNGSLDSTFGGDGMVTTDFGGADNARAMAIQTDGKLVSVGISCVAGGGCSFAIARYNDDGSRDATFGEEGKVRTQVIGGWGNSYSDANGVVLQRDGKLVVAGSVTASPRTRFALARYDTDGSLDPSFGAGTVTAGSGQPEGTVTTGFEQLEHGALGEDVAIQPDGKIVVAGAATDTYSDTAIARYNVDGSLDVSLGGGGTVTNDFGAVDAAHAVSLQPDNMILVAGSVQRLSDAGQLSDRDFMLARFVPTSTTCPDRDNDHLSDCTERALGTEGTDPDKPDTDEDGLQDSAEVDPSVPGAGVWLDGLRIPRHLVLGPFGPDNRKLGDADRVPPQYARYVKRPNRFKKDLYFELDWQDCDLGGPCPGELGLRVGDLSSHFRPDSTHHAPDVGGISDVVDALKSVANADGSSGVNANFLVDEPTPHNPNCDQARGSGLAKRAERFGTPQQREMAPAILEAKRRLVRYVWSGHSSRFDDAEQCPYSSQYTAIRQGLGKHPLPPYEWSPFGDAPIGGRDIAVSLSPMWNCSSKHLARLNPIKELNPPICFRTEYGQVPGVFPARVKDIRGADGNLHEREIKAPIDLLLGVDEREGGRQLWGRSMMHLIGHSLGLGADEAGNRPDLQAVDRTGDGRPDRVLPEKYEAPLSDYKVPTSIGVPHEESSPHYDELIAKDSDMDGVVEGEDNCPGTRNPRNSDGKQADLDGDGFGDACDPDRDGDLLIDPLPAETSAMRSAATANEPAATDQYPDDTDNDAVANFDDGDDDNDGIADASDNCQLIGNADQANLDRDGTGDVCDEDDDGDEVNDILEGFAGSSARSALSTPEFLGGEVRLRRWGRQ